MAEEQSKVCSGGSKLVFACSGAADVGEVTDLAARKMTADGTAKMFCMAGIGGKVEPIMKVTRAASKVLALDGCSLNCVKHSLEEAGFKGFLHLQLGEIGMEKGKAPASDENIDKVCTEAEQMLSE